MTRLAMYGRGESVKWTLLIEQRPALVDRKSLHNRELSTVQIDVLCIAWPSIRPRTNSGNFANGLVPTQTAGEFAAERTCRIPSCIYKDQKGLCECVGKHEDLELPSVQAWVFVLDVYDVIRQRRLPVFSCTYTTFHEGGPGCNLMYTLSNKIKENINTFGMPDTFQSCRG